MFWPFSPAQWFALFHKGKSTMYGTGPLTPTPLPTEEMRQFREGQIWGVPGDYATWRRIIQTYNWLREIRYDQFANVASYSCTSKLAVWTAWMAKEGAVLIHDPAAFPLVPEAQANQLIIPFPQEDTAKDAEADTVLEPTQPIITEGV